MLEADCLIRYHLHIDPDKLTDEAWAEHLAMLAHIRNQEATKK